MSEFKFTFFVCNLKEKRPFGMRDCWQQCYLCAAQVILNIFQLISESIGSMCAVIGRCATLFSTPPLNIKTLCLYSRRCVYTQDAAFILKTLCLYSKCCVYAQDAVFMLKTLCSYSRHCVLHSLSPQGTYCRRSVMRKEKPAAPTKVQAKLVRWFRSNGLCAGHHTWVQCRKSILRVGTFWACTFSTIGVDESLYFSKRGRNL